MDYKRWSWAFQQRAYPLGYIPSGAKVRALEEISQSEAKRGPPSVTSTGDLWVNIGPAPILGGQIGTQAGTRPMSGRIDAVAVDPANTNHWLIGAASGGVWESRDAGTNWTALTDAQPSLAMGALAFATSNIIYAGTGEADFGGTDAAGAGLLKSTDGGLSWQLLPATNFTDISFKRLKVNPTNPAVVLSANTRGFFGRDGENALTPPARGIFKSTNGGTNWSLKIAGEGTALEADATNFQRQYAGLGDVFGAATNGVYRSTNSGDAWTRIGGPPDDQCRRCGASGIGPGSLEPKLSLCKYSGCIGWRGPRRRPVGPLAHHQRLGRCPGLVPDFRQRNRRRLRCSGLLRLGTWI
jgi:hypothetical protein